MIEAEAERAGKRERSSSSSSSSSRRSSDLEKRFEIFHFLVMKSENTVRDTERERETQPSTNEERDLCLE